MSERAYTVVELDELRAVVERKWLWGSYRGPLADDGSRAYYPHEKTIEVEELVRTHMLAGHTAADLISSELERAH